MVCERQEYKYKDFTYILDENRRHIIEKEGETPPQNVYKYYGMNSFSIDALMKGYLYATCPFNFNDIMDSSEYLLDFSKITKEIYEKFGQQMLGNEKYKKNNWDEIYKKDKNNNFEDLRKCFYAIQAYYFGTICLTKSPFNILMWAHYAGETGFLIELDIKKCMDEVEEYNSDIRYLCFSPVQYVEKLEKIDVFREDLGSTDIPSLYKSNVKRKEWEYEQEWRLRISKESKMNTSFSFLNPQIPDIDNGLERRFYYNYKNIKKIVLGNHFFNGSNCSSIENYIIELKEDNENLVKLTNFLYENFNDRLYMSGILKSEKGLERYFEPITFEKIKHNKFKIIRKSMSNP